MATSTSILLPLMRNISLAHLHDRVFISVARQQIFFIVLYFIFWLWLTQTLSRRMPHLLPEVYRYIYDQRKAEWPFKPDNTTNCLHMKRSKPHSNGLLKRTRFAQCYAEGNLIVSFVWWPSIHFHQVPMSSKSFCPLNNASVCFPGCFITEQGREALVPLQGGREFPL